MINKILIRKSDRKTLHKDRRSLGMSGENLQEVLLFCLDEKIEGAGIVEVELPNGEKGMIEVECTEEGYELPIKSSLMAQTGFVKFQLRILHDNEEIFKSEIIPLEVKDSINATATIPEEYPSWVDTLTNLKKDLEKAESERVSNEEERQTAEEARQENFTEMQKTVKSAVSNIKDLKEDYNTNAKKKTDEFNNNFEEKQKAINDNAEAKTTAFGENAEAQTKTFNTNSDDKLAEYNRNHTAKMKEFDDNYDTKTKTFDDNAADKLDEYNKNTELKEKSFNDNAGTKTETFNSNAADKQNEFDENASDKLSEYNQNAKELINKVEQVQAENETLKAENKLIKEQIPSASASGNSIHVEDSGTLDFDWKIKGRHKQATREGYNLLDFNVEQNSKVTVNEDGTITINGTGGFSLFYSTVKFKTKTYSMKWQLVSGTATESSNHFFMIPGGKLWANKDAFTQFSFTEENPYNSLWISAGSTFTNARIKIWIYEGTEEKPYEPYGASPSIDYPSEIETVGSNVNEFDMNNVTTVYNGEKNINEIISNKLSGNYKFVRTSITNTKLVANNTYTVSFKAKKNEGTYSNNIGFQIFDTDGKVTLQMVENSPALSEKYQVYSFTFTITANINVTALLFQLQQNASEVIMSIKDIKLEKGTVATPYSPFGMGSVEIDVVNKNFYKASEKWFNNIGGVGLTVSERSNKECTLTTTQRAFTWFGSNQIGGSQEYRTKVKENTKYTFSFKAELLKGTAGIGLFIFFDRNLTSEYFEKKHKDYSSNITFVTPAGTNYIHFRIDIYNANTAYRISEIKIEAEDGTDKYEKHQSQTAIMSIQQEMLEGDYIKDVEHHEWQKFIFDGVTNRLNQKTGTSANNLYYTSYISNLLAPTSNGVKTEICSNCFKSYTANQLYGQDLVGVAVTTGKSFSIGFGLESGIDTLDKANEKLKELYDAGTPIIIYYKLAEAIDLELTSEQKAVRDTKLYTYKNITNIDVSDELASIDVEYKKNPATEHDDLQNQIDEIKQLISTTETSALLLDNLQKDVESEVE